MTPHVLLATCLGKMLKIHSCLLRRQVCFSSVKRFVFYPNSLCTHITTRFDYYNTIVRNLEITSFGMFCAFCFLTFTFCL